MIDTPQTERVEARNTAVIHLTVPRSEIREAVGPAVNEVLGHLSGQGAAPAGPMFFHHLRMSPDAFDVELGFPVAAPIAPGGRVRPGARPAMRIAKTVCTGPYENLPGAWGRFSDWIKAEGLQTAPDIWEWYLAGPESGSDPAAWRTELQRPLVE